MFEAALQMTGIVPSIEAVNGFATNDLGLGGQIALAFLGIFIVNILLARFTKWKYIFLTGQAILWMATMTVGVRLCGRAARRVAHRHREHRGRYLCRGHAGSGSADRAKIIGNDAIALGKICTVGYLFEAGVAWLVRKRNVEKQPSVEELEASSLVGVPPGHLHVPRRRHDSALPHHSRFRGP